jgi:hypothetical protein
MTSRTTVGLLAVLAIAAAGPVAVASGSDSSPVHYYVSLGDSHLVGLQPIGDPPFFETDQGYADREQSPATACALIRP